MKSTDRCHRRRRLPAATLLLILLALLVSCAALSSAEPLADVVTTAAPTRAATSAPAPTGVPAGTSLSTAPAEPSPTPAATEAAATVPARQSDGVCGMLLPLGAPTAEPLQPLEPDPSAAAELRALVPAAALPGLEYLLANPEKVGLAADRAGQQADGAYLNADVPLPLASVVKIVTLVAYAEAVSAGALQPTTTVPLADIEAFYLPTLDLNAHPKAVAALEDEGRVFGDPPAVLLDAVPEMMMTHSSNAAADYLQMLLGQEVIEQTAVDLGLTTQTAPCPFLGQFLTMSNHTREGQADEAAFAAYTTDPATYGVEVMALTQAFSNDDAFRSAAIEWRTSTRRPNGRVQRAFTEAFNARASAVDYAALMTRLAQNGLGSSESSYTARRLLEWPMRFPVNQEVFSNLGYKGGSMPGVLTSAYYAYPLGDTTPVVAALFFHDLPPDVYREFRSGEAHDELVRWLLYESKAIPLLRAALSGS